VGDLGLAAQQAARASKRAKKAAAPVSAEIPAVAPLPDERKQARRRRPVKTAMIGRGYEYMDLESEPTVTASDRDSGTVGFAGSAARDSGAEPAGLATLTRDQFGGSSTVPMLPGTWNPDLD
jgi:PPE-repeat protein